MNRAEDSADPLSRIGHSRDDLRNRHISKERQDVRGAALARENGLISDVARVNPQRTKGAEKLHEPAFLQCAVSQVFHRLTARKTDPKFVQHDMHVAPATE